MCASAFEQARTTMLISGLAALANAVTHLASKALGIAITRFRAVTGLAAFSISESEAFPVITWMPFILERGADFRQILNDEKRRLCLQSCCDPFADLAVTNDNHVRSANYTAMARARKY